MAHTHKILSENNQQLLRQLEYTVSSYPVSVEKLQETILAINPDQESDTPIINSKIQALFKTLLMTLLNFQVDRSSADWQKKCGLPQDRLVALKNVLEAVCGGPASQKLKRSVVISFIQNVLECLGVSDLTEVLDVISTQIPRFASQLQQSDQLKLLRVINVLLKTVSKTQDYHLRGQLHLALTRFLPFCHDSGFHFRAPPAKPSEWEKIGPEQEGADTLAPGLTYEFYQQFWELQTWFMEPSEVAGEGMLNRLKRIEHILKEVQQYFETHPAKEGSDYYNQPIKFLKNYYLLALQLGDLFFRKTIMLQTLLFTYALKHPLTKAPIILGQHDKKIINEIEAIANRFLMSCGEEGKQLLEELPKLVAGEMEWAQLKEQWKDKKKHLLKRAEQYAQQENKSKEEVRKCEKEIEKRRSQVRKTISQKMKIEGSKIQSFLQNSQPISLQSGPSCTSFTYFFSQAMSCLQTFDKETGKQTEFQTRSQYNMFQWKAMRSLYRQNIKDIWSSNDKAPPKMKEYRLISLMSRKEEEFTDPEPTKKLKQE